ncbi:MAG TPA: preprotein translocase subunit YajC [Blastocatellia bacterium]|jgi:preprotein translocase subunit YajC|nr:preprotein translocase subunit YajC [Blastocatellia bacterium]
MEMVTDLHSLLFILQGGGQTGGPGLFVSLLPMIIIFAIFYFLLIRPQQRRQRQLQEAHDRMIRALKPGDKVVTSGGIYGTIVAVRDKEDTVLLRVAQSVSIEVERRQISRMQGEEAGEAEAVKLNKA